VLVILRTIAVFRTKFWSLSAGQVTFQVIFRVVTGENSDSAVRRGADASSTSPPRIQGQPLRAKQLIFVWRHGTGILERNIDDCTVRDEWFIKRSLELRAKMIMIKMFKEQKEQVE
jgi:hypothetical protein